VRDQTIIRAVSKITHERKTHPSNAHVRLKPTFPVKYTGFL